MIPIEGGMHKYLHVMLCALFLFIGIRNPLVGQDEAVYITMMSTDSSRLLPLDDYCDKLYNMWCDNESGDDAGMCMENAVLALDI